MATLTAESILDEIAEAIESGTSLMMEDLTEEAQAVLRAHAEATGTDLPLPSREEL